MRAFRQIEMSQCSIVYNFIEMSDIVCHNQSVVDVPFGQLIFPGLVSSLGSTAVAVNNYGAF